MSTPTTSAIMERLRETLLPRVRARLERARAHLRAALAGHDTDLLYAWDVLPVDGPHAGEVMIPAATAREWAKVRLGHTPAPDAARPGAHVPMPSPQGVAYIAAMRSWPMPPLELWRTAYRQAFADTFPNAPDLTEEAWRLTSRTGDEPARFAAALDRQLRAVGALEPDALPLRMTIADGLARLDADAERLVADTTAALLASLDLVTPRLRAAVSDREELVMRCPWPGPTTSPPARVLAILSALVESVPSGELAPGAWPPEVAPDDVATWAAPRLEHVHAGDLARQVRQEAEGWRSGRPERVSPLMVALAVLYATLQAIEKDRGRVAMRLDAGRPHHDLITGWRDLPKDTHTPYQAPTIDGRIELLAPGGGCVQLTLDYGEGSPSEALITALREMRGWKGLRHWAAVQTLLSVDGGSQGWVRWTLDGHLNALGISVKHRSKADVRAQVARQVELFTKLEIAVYAKDGTLRTRRPLLIVGAKYDRLKDSKWELDGMQLTINPLLYAGVRQADGTLGRNWFPAPVELAQVDDKKHPYTLALGHILPIRWRLALEEGKNHVTIKGSNALALAGIHYRAHKPGVAWKALERDLTELQRIKELGRWEWDAADTPRTLEGRLHLWPAQWARDRTLHAVRPRELPPGPAVLTGEELKVWRTRHGLTQRQAAKKIGVSRPTIARAEAHPLDALTLALTAKMRAAGAADTAPAVDESADDDSAIRADD